MSSGSDRAVDDARPEGRPTISLIVPLWNEEDRLRQNGPELLAFTAGLGESAELVLVDDGSTDGTVTVADGIRASAPDAVQVVRVAHAGKGAALRAGIEAARGETVAFCDVDLATSLDDLRLLIERAATSGALVIGSRDIASSRLLEHEPAAREGLGKLYNKLAQAVLVRGIRDTQCGAKAAPAAVWRRLLEFSAERGFAWDLEIVAVALRMGVPVEEVGVAWAHQPGSKVRVIADGADMVRAVARIRRRLPRAGTDHESTVGAFSGENAEQLAANDAEHWWFAAKAASVKQMLRGRRDESGWLVDCGAGAGGVSAALGWPAERVLVVEPGETLVLAAGERGLKAVQAEAFPLPLMAGAASVVCVLDVIEHLDDPVAALIEARRVLQPGGIVVVNVPAHQWLWSPADEVLGHRRRYTRKLLRAQLEDAGLKPVSVSHTFAWLVPPVWWRRRRSANPELGLDEDSRLITTVARVVSLMERQVLRVTSLPFGTSILAVGTPYNAAEPV